MTLYVNETNLTVAIALNLSDSLLGTGYEFIITSQYSHQPLVLEAECIETNDRYSTFVMTFPTGFGEEHKNGVYYWDITYLTGGSLQKGLIKITTEPGGGINSLAYDAGYITDDRVSQVYYRPNY